MKLMAYCFLRWILKLFGRFILKIFMVWNLLVNKWLTFVFGYLNRSTIRIAIKVFWLYRLISRQSLRFLKHRLVFHFLFSKIKLLYFPTGYVRWWKMAFRSNLLQIFGQLIQFGWILIALSIKGLALLRREAIVFRKGLGHLHGNWYQWF